MRIAEKSSRYRLWYDVRHRMPIFSQSFHRGRPLFRLPAETCCCASRHHATAPRPLREGAVPRPLFPPFFYWRVVALASMQRGITPQRRRLIVLPRSAEPRGGEIALNYRASQLTESLQAAAQVACSIRRTGFQLKVACLPGCGLFRQVLT